MGGMEEGGHEATIRAAADVASGVHRPSRAPSEPERGVAQQKRIASEAAALRQWAKPRGLIRQSSDFDRSWEAGGKIEGGENQVFIRGDGRTVSKRNNLSYHSSYQQFFERLLLHNWIFPWAMLSFDGFSDTFEGLHALLSQPVIVSIRPAFRQQVEPYMKARGFVATDEKGWNYFSPKTGLVVEDLHEYNAVIDSRGRVVIFDPVIYANPPKSQWPKLHRIGLLDANGRSLDAVRDGDGVR